MHNEPGLPLAIYIHVPFCGRRCLYCHFDIKVLHPRTDPREYHQTFLTALKRETAYYAERLGNRSVTSLFLGGGTPSRLNSAHLGELFDDLTGRFHLDSDCEISMEVNPEDGAPAYLKMLQDLGVNRLSLGVQTFSDPSLKAVRRLHSAAQARRVLEEAPAFAKGISLDLMLGLPLQTLQVVESDLAEVARMRPSHLSVYMLERDLPTPLDQWTQQVSLPSEDDQADFYEHVCRFLGSVGYRHYEISNFSLPGFTSRHNLNYWHCGDYLGLGPAAHGRLGLDYYRNDARLNDYAGLVLRGGSGVAHAETWSRERLRQERIVQGLRLATGVPRDWLTAEEINAVQPFLDLGLTLMEGRRLKLTEKGWLLGNELFQIFTTEPTSEA